MKMEHAEDAGPLDDAALVVAAQHDRTAFGLLYERYVDSIYRDIYRQVGNHDDAEAVTAQTFQHALAALPDFAQRGAPLGPWLRSLAHDLSTQHKPMSGQDVMVDERADVAQNPTGADVASRTLQPAQPDEIRSALRQLPLDQQRAIVFRFAYRRTSHETGTMLGQSENTVKQLVYRALIALRAALESE